jgi:hypothetical protein
MREKPSAQIGHNSKPRSLDVIAAEIHGLERRNIFEYGALLAEAREDAPGRARLEHGEWQQWIEEQDFDFGYTTALNYLGAYRLKLKCPTVGDLKVPMRVIYDLADIEDSDLPAIIEALAKASKSKKLSVADAEEVVGLTLLQIQYGNYPPETLWALRRLPDDEEWAKQASEKLKQVKPTDEEEADRIIASYRPPDPDLRQLLAGAEPDEPKVEEESEEGEAAAPEESVEKVEEGEDEEDEAPASLAEEKDRIVGAWSDASAGARAEFVRERWNEIFIVREQLLAIDQESRETRTIQ